ncbi:hypothetical protein SXCC_00390 [Gluconacetobacter sp. SXCC-1]|nr:hypothetical protein SXCC_00390 [Gluconacetobacter sp. SXCC-1]
MVPVRLDDVAVVVAITHVVHDHFSLLVIFFWQTQLLPMPRRTAMPPAD